MVRLLMVVLLLFIMAKGVCQTATDNTGLAGACLLMSDGYYH